MSMLDTSFIWMLAGLVGALAVSPFLWIIDRNVRNTSIELHADVIGLCGFIGGVIGGLLGVAIIGPVGQIVWRTASDMLAGTPDRNADHGWPYPISLWYSAWIPGAIVGGIVVGLVAVLIAKRWFARKI